MILDRWSYQAMYLWTLIFCIIPVLLELRILCLARGKYRIVGQLEEEENAKREAAHKRLGLFAIKIDKEKN